MYDNRDGSMSSYIHHMSKALWLDHRYNNVIISMGWTALDRWRNTSCHTL